MSAGPFDLKSMFNSSVMTPLMEQLAKTGLCPVCRKAELVKGLDIDSTSAFYHCPACKGIVGMHVLKEASASQSVDPRTRKTKS
jgi:transcription elongation factor Elf1